ncbi:MAG: hypothetical protein WCY30_00055 [Candidatus Neomarinimicrobiota bacterium]|jgi:uncharacterized protein YdbL (DUF1318 family)
MTFARAELIAEGCYGAININQAREFVCILVKLWQREMMVSGNILLASASTRGKVSEALKSYLSIVYKDYDKRVKQQDVALKKQLDEMSKIDFKSILSIPKGYESIIIDNEELLGLK